MNELFNYMYHIVKYLFIFYTCIKLIYKYFLNRSILVHIFERNQLRNQNDYFFERLSVMYF
jgi:hypothetical protein